MRITLLVAVFTLLLPSLVSAADLRPTVAVLYFDYSGKDPEMESLKKGLAQMLISDLASLDGVRLVERERLEAILSELKLAESGKLDGATAAKVGKLLGAKYLVMGGYFDLMKTLRADARVVEVETSKVLKSIGASGAPEEFLGVEQKLAEGIGAILATEAKAFVPAKEVKPSSIKESAPKMKAPARLKTATALRYGKALHALDHGDKEGAKKTLLAVVKEQPDFKLAARDLDRLMQ